MNPAANNEPLSQAEIEQAVKIIIGDFSIAIEQRVDAIIDLFKRQPVDYKRAYSDQNDARRSPTANNSTQNG